MSRKVALVIHVEHAAGPRLVALGKTCRLCVDCDVLIAHEAEVASVIRSLGLGGPTGAPEFLVLGTVDLRAWRKSLTAGTTIKDLRDRIADFRDHLRVEVTPAGWVVDRN
jgi:hypothetical protein